VSSGSTSACWARISGEATPSLRPVSRSTTTAPPDTSEPVPEVVGTLTSPMRGSATVSAPASSRANGVPCEWAARAALARSSAEPPPIPTTASGGCARIRATSASTSSTVGSPGGFS